MLKLNKDINLLIQRHRPANPENDPDVTQISFYYFIAISHLLATLLYNEGELHNNSKLFQKLLHHCNYKQPELLPCLITFHVFHNHQQLFFQQISDTELSSLL